MNILAALYFDPRYNYEGSTRFSKADLDSVVVSIYIINLILFKLIVKPLLPTMKLMPNSFFSTQDYLELLARRMRLSDEYSSSPSHESLSQDSSEAMDTDDSEPNTPDFTSSFDKPILKTASKVCPDGSLRDRIIKLQTRAGKPSAFKVLNYWSIDPDPNMKMFAAVVLAVPVKQVNMERAFN